MKHRLGLVLTITGAIALSLLSVEPSAAATNCVLQTGKTYRTATSPGVYYVSDTCTKRPIKNPDVFFSHFTSWDDVAIITSANLEAVPNDALSFLPWGTRRIFGNGSLIKTVGDSRVYLLENFNQLYPIASEAVFRDLGLQWSWVEDVVPEMIGLYNKQSTVTSIADYPDGLIFRYNNGPQIYQITHYGTVSPTKMYLDSWETVQRSYRVDRISVFPSTRSIPDTRPIYDPIPPTVPTTPTPPPVVTPPPSTPGSVSTVGALRSAIAAAQPGAVITIAPGTYDLMGGPIATVRGGTASAPITIRAATAGQVIIQTNGSEEAFKISHPYYTFENLTVQVRGAGSSHAYKIDTDGHDTIIRGGTMVVYKGGESGVKGSGSGTAPYPDNVLIERNDISYTEPTDNGQAEGIDAVGVRGWIVRNNTIHGIKQANTGLVAWAVVFKGNSQDTIIEQNLFYDNDIAISIGGSTAAEYFRDGNREYEHRRATVRNNVSMNTRSVALYIEKGNDTRIYNNTFVSTFVGRTGDFSSIDVRYPASTADIRNTLLDRRINDRDGGTHTATYDVIIDGQFPMTEFTDAVGAGHDLRPRVGTRLFDAIVDRGTPLEQVRTDKDGTARPVGNNYDIGAYERTVATVGATPPATTNPPVVVPSTTPPVVVGSLSLVREDASGLPGMYGGSWGVADFDGDLLPDIVVYGHYRTMFHGTDNPTGGNDELRLYKNVSTVGGAIRFSLQQVVPDNNGNRGAIVVVGDFNGDSRPDFAVQTRNGGRGAGFINGGSWQFTRREFAFANESGTFIMTAADVNVDGRDDLIFASDGNVNAGLWYSYGSNNTWEAHQTDFAHRITYGGTMAAGDLTGDAYPEFVVGGNALLPFGNHDCSATVEPISSGAKLQYGQAVYNQRGLFLPTPLAIVGAFGYKVPEATRHNLNSCHGMDNAQMLIRDVDKDGKNDVIITGSSTGQDGAIGKNGQQYDFAVLFNDGTGVNYTIWENTGPQNDNGGTNGGVGNLDFPSIAVGDLTGDGLPDIFVQGHRRDFSVTNYPYVYEDMMFVNNGDRTFSTTSLASYLPTFTSSYVLPSGLTFLANRPRYVAEGGDAIVDFNRDGKLDLLFSGAELPYHTNGINYRDYNTEASIKTYVLRNTK